MCAVVAVVLDYPMEPACLVPYGLKSVSYTHLDVYKRQVVYDAYMEVGRNYCGKLGKPEAYSNSLHNLFGAVMGALPNGREARRALTDGSVSAMPGTDTQGPTALVNSAAKAVDTLRFNSNHFNMKFHPSAVESPQGMRNLLN